MGITWPQLGKRGKHSVPVLKGEKTTRDTPIFWEWSRGQAVYSAGYKIVRQGKEQPWDLYHIEKDPTETENLANVHPDKVKEMDQMFKEWKDSVSGEQPASQAAITSKNIAVGQREHAGNQHRCIRENQDSEIVPILQ